MASYFVACHALADGAHAVHDRARCAPACFPRDGATEYLGEFTDAVQAIAVARLRYAPVRGCSCTHEPLVNVPAPTATASAAFTPLRP